MGQFLIPVMFSRVVVVKNVTEIIEALRYDLTYFPIAIAGTTAGHQDTDDSLMSVRTPGHSCH